MMKSQWACNIPLYPGYIKSLIEKEGAVGELAGIYTGELTMVEISPVVAVKTYFAYMFGGNLKKIGCMIRPYEINPGETDRVVLECRGILERAFLGELGFTDAVKQAMDRLDKIPRRKTDRPKVAVFGDLYVRDNEVMNQNLIRCIEDAGGEALLTPYNDYAKIISGPLFKRWLRELRLPGVVLFKSLLAAMEILEGRYHGYLGKYIGKATSSRNPQAEEQLARFNIRIEQEGESYENLLKIFHIMKEHPDVALFVQTNPAFCCPSLVTEAMSRDIEEITGVPVVSITYDGTESPKNDVIIPYLKFAGTRKRRQEADPPGVPAV
jgi:predicted nucleotide-binding protein (sugar kinase/HSP70/actin superfamily)